MIPISSVTIPNTLSACYAIPGLKYCEAVVEKKPNSEETLKLIEKTVCNYYFVNRELLHKKCRKREVVLTRYVIIYFFKIMTTLTLVKIGNYFNFDHTTVLHGIKTLRDLIETDETILKDVEYLKSILYDNK